MQQHKINKFVKSESEQWMNSQNSIPGLLPDIATKHIQSRLLTLIASNMVIIDKSTILTSSLSLLKLFSTKAIDKRLVDAASNYRQASTLDCHSRYGSSDTMNDNDRLLLVSSLMFLATFAEDNSSNLDDIESNIEELQYNTYRQNSILLTA